MWVLLIAVWTLSNGQMVRTDFVGNDTYQTRAECIERGSRAVRELTEGTPNSQVAGMAYICSEEQPTRPSRPPLAREPRAYPA